MNTISKEMIEAGKRALDDCMDRQVREPDILRAVYLAMSSIPQHGESDVEPARQRVAQFLEQYGHAHGSSTLMPGLSLDDLRALSTLPPKGQEGEDELPNGSEFGLTVPYSDDHLGIDQTSPDSSVTEVERVALPLLLTEYTDAVRETRDELHSGSARSHGKALSAEREVLQRLTAAIQSLPLPDEGLRSALRKARLALEPIARRVFNDNGDHTINTAPFDGDVYSACYYAARTIDEVLRHGGLDGRS